MTGIEESVGSPRSLGARPFTALSRLGFQPEECVVIEDSPRGLQAAVAAGLRCIVLRTPLTAQHPFSEAFAVVNTVDELATQLNRMVPKVAHENAP